jgi:cyanate permease
MTFALAFALLAIGFAESAIFSVVTAGLHHKATFLGILETAQGIGAVTGGLIAAWVLRRTSEGVMTSLALLAVTAGALLLTAPALVPVLAGMALAGVALPWINVAVITAIQRRSPPELIGRVAGAFTVSFSVPQAISIGLGAALISVISYQALLVTIAVACGLAATYLVSHSQARVKPLRA